MYIVLKHFAVMEGKIKRRNDRIAIKPSKIFNAISSVLCSEFKFLRS